MPGKKKKYNARFPPARIKKIMQSDDEVGKVAAPVPVIISRALEMFAETLLHRARKVTSQRGARTLTPSHLKFCIQSETRFDFLKELVGSVPELQGDMDVEGGLGVMGESRNTEHRPAGLGRARGVGRASVPGTGKRRGRPPKVAGAPPSARTKRSVEKFVEDEDDSGDIIEIESDHWPPPKKLCNGSSSNSPQTPSPLQSPQERLLLPQPETSQRLNSFSSPFNIQRSASQEDFVGGRVAPSPSTTSSASSSSCPPGLSGLPFQLEINKDTTDSASPGLYQRTTSLPPPAPVYTGSYSRLFRSSSTSSNTLQATARNGAGTTFKLQTNGNFPVSGTHSQPSPASGLKASTSQTNPAGPGQELDEDYDC